MIHVDCVIQFGSYLISSSVSSCVTPSTMSWVMGVYCALSSALHFCPDVYIDGSTQNAATRRMCVSQSADCMFAVTS
jgi:hypothetical protein